MMNMDIAVNSGRVSEDNPHTNAATLEAIPNRGTVHHLPKELSAYE